MSDELREAIARAKAAWAKSGGDAWARKWRPYTAQLELPAAAVRERMEARS